MGIDLTSMMKLMKMTGDEKIRSVMLLYYLADSMSDDDDEEKEEKKSAPEEIRVRPHYEPSGG